jgi:tRNA1Val (adenine37-N6)-methyltransferase
MPNDYFDFQLFRVRQGRTAMKVTSEACLLGAWFAAKPLRAASILDIGAGTGLLMLMLAQKQACPIDGIELDAEAADQCRENLLASPWADRMRLYQGDVRTWDPSHRYDFILSNPPFYERSLLREDARMNQAMHGTSLTLESLADVMERLASPTGMCGMLLPVERTNTFESRMQALGFGTRERVTVRHSRNHPPMRQILCLTRGWSGQSREEELFLAQPGDLLSDYYLRPDPMH